MRCDLHVHTIHSGQSTVPLARRFCRESYNDPEEVYHVLKRRGMDLVTVTDHDSIDSVECLRRSPDFFLSEEISAVTPDGNNVHIGVYGITERQHIGLQARRNDFFALLGYVREHDLVCSVNHIFSSLTGRRSQDDFGCFASFFEVVETLNGQIPSALNESAAAFALGWRKSSLAGSDSHTLDGLGRTYTEIRGARTVEEFLARLRAGHGRACGESGGYWKLTRAVWQVCCAMNFEKPWTAMLAPLWLAVPLVTMGNLVQEHLFNYHWSRRVQQLAVRADTAKAA